MKIKKLRLENFKAAPNREIALSKMNLFVGANGKGKSSILAALRFLLNGSLPPDPIKHGQTHLHVCANLDDGQDTLIERFIFQPDTYRINGADVSEKDFVKEVKRQHEIYEKNGGFPVLGNATNPYFEHCDTPVLWEFLENGKVEGAKISGLKELELELFDGTVLYMSKSKPSGCAVAGKKMTFKKYNEFIEDRMGGNAMALDIVTSSEVMAAMEMTDFAKYLVSIIPVTVDFNKLAELGKLTDEEKQILADIMPPSPHPITVEDIAGAYKMLFDTRAGITRRMEECRAKAVYNGEPPKESLEEIKGKLEAVQRQIGAAENLKKAWQVYENQVIARKKAVDTGNAWVAEYNSMKNVVQPNESLLPNLKTQEQNLRNQIDADQKLIARMEQANVPLQKMLAGLASSVCPICDKLTCTTDKTVCKNDIEGIVANNRLTAEEAKTRIGDRQRMLDIVLQQQDQARDFQVKWTQKTALKNRIDEYRKTIPAVPQKPEEMKDISALLEEAERLSALQTGCVLYAKSIEAAEEYKKLKAQYTLYTELLKKAEPKKGLLTNTLLEFILRPFEEYCNSFLKMIYEDACISFRMGENGIQVYCRPHGAEKAMVPVKALSDGERMLAVFALMDMISGISNTRMLVFDRLESLDAVAFRNLINMLGRADVQERYDHILMATVDHDDVKQTIEGLNDSLNVVYM